MCHTARVALHVAALAGAALVLVADSAGPSCEVYEGFDLSFAYETDCLGGDSGAVSMAMDEQRYEDWGRPDSESVTVDQREGELEIMVMSVHFDISACGDTTGTGLFDSLSIGLSAGGGGAEVADYYCYGWLDGVASQDLACESGQDPAETCSLQLLPQ